MFPGMLGKVTHFFGLVHFHTALIVDQTKLLPEASIDKKPKQIKFKLFIDCNQKQEPSALKIM